MSTATRYSFDYVFELASQLSAEEQERLVQKMSVSSRKHDTESKKIKMVEYTVPGTPIISQEELKGFEEARREINR